MPAVTKTAGMKDMIVLLITVREMDLNSVTQIACIAQTGNNIFLFVQNRVNRSAPQGHIRTIVERLTQRLNCLWRTDCGAEMRVLGFTVTEAKQESC